jgi:hypothetical protein
MNGPGGLPGDRSGTNGPRPFSGRELDDVAGVMPDELAAETRIARELEVIVDRAAAAPSAGFADRVMDAVGREPVPAPTSAAGRALRRGSFAAFLASLRDAWRVATRSGFPVAVRAQALALVLVVAVLAAGSGLATAGAIGLLGGTTPSPRPSIETRTSAPEPSVATPEPTDFAAPPITEPSDSAVPSETPDDEAGEPPGTEDPEGDRAPTAAPTAAPTHRATRAAPTATPGPTHTEDPEDGGDHEDSTSPPGPSPSTSPGPTSTPDD